MPLYDLIRRVEQRRELRARRLVGWPVRVGVWVLFVGALVAGLGAVGDLTTDQSVGSQPGDRVVAGVDVTTPVGVSAQGPGVVVIPDDCGGGQVSAPGEPCPNGTNKGFSRFNDDPEAALPLVRWNDSLGRFSSNLGVDDTVRGTTMSGIMGRVAFEMSGLLWNIMMRLVRFADNADFLTAMSGTINTQFVKIAAAVWPLLALGYLLVLIRIAREVLRGDAGGMMRLLAGFVIPVAFITVMVQSVTAGGALAGANGAIGGQGAGTLVTGTPAWMADTVVDSLDESSERLAALFSPITTDTNMLLGTNSEQAYNCQPYIESLTQTYITNTEGSGDGGPTLMINNMWLASSYEMWSMAAFGDQAYRHKASCHAAEWWSDVPAAEQQRIANLVYGGAWDISVFSPTGRDFGNREWSEEQWHFGMWQACTDSGVTSEWGEALSVVDEGGDWSAMCEQWRGPDGMAKDKGINEGVEKVYQKAGDIDDVTVSRWIEASLGKSPEIFSMGFASLLSAVVYLWAFGGVAIGVIASKIGLVLALMLLPFTLTMIGLGMEAGGRLLRWTASLCGIDLVFTAVMALLMLMTMLGVSLILGGPLGAATASGGVQAGLGRTIVVCMVPIGAVMATNRVLKQAGFGKITSPTSALGLVGRASAKAYNADTTSGYMRAGYHNKKERAAAKYQDAVRRGQGVGAALDKVTDPFGTGRTKLKRLAANSANLAEKDPAHEKQAQKDWLRWQAAEREHQNKKDRLLNLPGRAKNLAAGVGKLGGAAATTFGSGGTLSWASVGAAMSGVNDLREAATGNDAASARRGMMAQLGDLKAGITDGEAAALGRRTQDAEERAAQHDYFVGRGNGAPGLGRSSDVDAREEAQRGVNQEYTEKTHQYVGGVGSFQLSPEARSSVGDQYLASLLAQAFAAQLGRTELVADLRNGDVEAMRVPETARSSLTGQYASEWGVDRSWVMVDDYGNGWLNRGAIDNIGDVPESLRDRPELRVDPDTWSEWSSAARGDNGALATMVGSHMVASGYLRIEGDQAVLQSMDVDSRSWGLQGASFINGNLGGEAYAQRIQSRYGPLDLGDSDVSQELQGIIVRGRTGDGPSVYEQASQAADQAVGVASVAAAQPTAAGNVDQMRSVLDSFLGEFRSALAGGVNISTAPTRVVMDETAQVRLDSGSIAEIAGAVHTAVGSVHVGPAMDGQAIAASIQSALESSNGTVDLSSQLAEVVESIRMVAPDMAALVLGGQIAAHGPSVDGSVEAEALVGAAESIQVAADALQSAAGANDAEGVRALLEDLVSQMSSQAAASYAVTEELQRAAGSLSDSARDLAASTARYGNGGGSAPSAEDVTAYGGR